MPWSPILPREGPRVETHEWTDVGSAPRHGEVPPIAADALAMSPRAELVATAGLAAATLAADAVALATGNGRLAAIAVTPALAVCTGVALVVYVRAARTGAGLTSPVSHDPVTGLPDAGQLRSDL